MSQWETKRGFIFVTRNDQQMRYGFGRFGLAFRAFQSFPSVQYYPAVVLSSGTNSERNRSKASWDLEGLVMLHFPGEWKRLSATDVCCGGTPFLNLTSFPSSSGERWETGQMQKFVKTRPEFVKSGGEWVGKPHPGQGVPEGDPMALLAVPTGVLPSSLAPPEPPPLQSFFARDKVGSLRALCQQLGSGTWEEVPVSCSPCLVWFAWFVWALVPSAKQKSCHCAFVVRSPQTCREPVSGSPIHKEHSQGW